MTPEKKADLETKLRAFCRAHGLRAIVTLAMEEDRTLVQLVGDTENADEDRLADSFAEAMREENGAL